MEYISNALVLPVPLNLVRIPRAVVEYCCEGCSEEEYVEEEEDNDVMLNGTYDAPPIIKNGIEVRSTKTYIETGEHLYGVVDALFHIYSASMKSYQ